MDEPRSPALHFRWTILHVPDVPAALGVLRAGLRPEARSPTRAASTASLRPAARRWPSPPMSGRAPRRPRPAGRTPDRRLRVALAADPQVSRGRLARRSRPAAPVKPLATMPWGQTVGFVRDPDGVLVEICTPPARLSALLAQLVPQLLHLGEEAFRFRLVLLALAPPAFSNSRSSSCWRLVRFTGVSTTISTNMSPRAGRAARSCPCLAAGSACPLWVPAGTANSRRRPSIVGTSTWPPSAAVVIGIGTRQKMFGPSRRKRRCGATVTKM